MRGGGDHALITRTGISPGKSGNTDTLKKLLQVPHTLVVGG